MAQRSDDIVRETIEELLELVTNYPTFVRSSLRDIMSLMLDIANFPEFEGSTRRTALEFLLSLTREGKGMVRKVREFAVSVIPLAVRFSLDLEHTEEWEDYKEDHGDMENHYMGLEAMERLADSLGERIFMEVKTELFFHSLHLSFITFRHVSNHLCPHSPSS